MPSYDGKKLVSETVSRDRNHARLVITLEVEVTNEHLDTLPAYRRNAREYIKDMYQEQPDILNDLVEQLWNNGIIVNSSNLDGLG